MRRKSTSIDWQKAPDIQREIRQLVSLLEFDHVDAKRIVCFRSTGAKTRARARIWSLPRIWQLALSIPAYYIIEVISEKFDHLRVEERQRVLIHKLMHIPKNFSGSLVPHRGRYHAINHHTVETLFRRLSNKITGN